MRLLFLLMSMLTFASCSNSEELKKLSSENEQLQMENKKLVIQLDSVIQLQNVQYKKAQELLEKSKQESQRVLDSLQAVKNYK